jgi:hypothetical protein
VKARKSGSGVVCPDWPPEYADQEGGRNSRDKRHDLALIRQVYKANHIATAIRFPQTNRRVRDSCYHPPRAPITAERRVDAQASVRCTRAPTRPTKQRMSGLGKLCIAKSDNKQCKVKKLRFPFPLILIFRSPSPQQLSSAANGHLRFPLLQYDDLGGCT